MSGQPRRLVCLGCKDRDAIIIRLENMHHANIYEYVTNEETMPVILSLPGECAKILTRKTNSTLLPSRYLQPLPNVFSCVLKASQS